MYTVHVGAVGVYIMPLPHCLHTKAIWLIVLDGEAACVVINNLIMTTTTNKEYVCTQAGRANNSCVQDNE